MAEVVITVIVWVLMVMRGAVALLGYRLNRRFIAYLEEELSGRVARGQNGDQALVLQTDLVLLKFVSLVLLIMWLTVAIRLVLVPFWFFGVWGLHAPHFDIGAVIGSCLVLYLTHRAYRVVYAKLKERRALALDAENAK